MRIINKTHYRTRDLRTLAVKTAREELTPKKAKLVTVIFGYRRSNPGNDSTSGFAWLGGTICCINLSRHGVDQVDLTLTLAHEFAHLRGLVHRQMQNAQYRRMGKWREWYAWAAAYPVRRRKRSRGGSTDLLPLDVLDAVFLSKRLGGKLRVSDC